MSPIEQQTADGVPVVVGDRVWTSDASGVRQTTMLKHHLGMWWQVTSKIIFSTEYAAIEHAIASNVAALKKAKTEQRRATKAIARFRGRLLAQITRLPGGAE